MADIDKDLKIAIQSSIKAFANGDVSKNALALFSTLGYDTDRQDPFDKKTYQTFKESHLDSGSRINEVKFSEDKAMVNEWKSVDRLFQLSKNEVSGQQSLFDTKKVKWEGEDKETVIETYLFFAIELEKAEYTRTALAQITREVNKVFPMPVMLVFKHGKNITISAINRRIHKRDERKDVLDVLKKVTLIKDISIENPHRAHIEILFDLSFDELQRNNRITNFVELHNAWQKTLDIKELNKRFFQELAHWYFWAMDNVSFPDDVEKNEEIRNATNLIRLLTRVIFIWFIKEKDLVPEILFNKNQIDRLIKNFNKDQESHNYYNAILQNLFFATLNQKMGERDFATDGSFGQNKKNYGIKNLYRYSDQFAIKKEEAINLFKDIPFLNGGLFDCLDKDDENGKVLYSDGFSRNQKKQAIVPDFLFFDEEHEYDLNKVYDTKNKTYKVKGLFDILTNYKFTITENTPIEEDIALDPELLGRVFENLLANYTPETKTTARKQTGSFYTPREIVNYMVDESIKAYLKQKLEAEASMDSEEADIGLELLIGYYDEENLFDEKQTDVLINAIDNCKILDPACGSGAFPMGILHKLVHILHKLDPDNKLWKERQIEKAQAIDDVTIREQLIEDIETAFSNNELDYGRKLYLIENCIYGVDIQPIATQISKLRFFISLIVDQKTDKTKDNLGIRSLPNLETKFVAANTLIGIEKPDGFNICFDSAKIQELEKGLKDIRHRIFSAKTPRKKRELREKDKEIREKMAELLEQILNDEIENRIASSKEVKEIEYYRSMIEKNGNKGEFIKEIEKREDILEQIREKFSSQSHKTARQLAGWDPYDQNASSPFFDPEWMFGISDGFDVVIGNPPYVDSENMVKNFPGLREEINQKYETAKGNWDLYVPFFELGHNLLKEFSIGVFITPNKWISIGYGNELRKYIANDFIGIAVCSKVKVFDAGNNPLICFFCKRNNKDIFFVDIFGSDYVIESRSSIDNIFKRSDNWGILLAENMSIVDKIRRNKELLGKSVKCENPFATSEAYKLIDILNEYEVGQTSFKLVNTGTIEPYTSLWGIKTTSYLKNKYKMPSVTKNNFKKEFPRRFEQASSAKIIISGMRNFECLFDEFGEYIAGKSTLIIRDTPLISFKYLTCLLNSKIVKFFLQQNYSAQGIDGGINFNSDMVENLPYIDFKGKEFDYLFEYIVRTVNIAPMYSLLIGLIDAIIYELYFPEEIKFVGCEVLKHLTNLPELKDDWSDEQKLATIEKAYKEFSDPAHPISIAMEKMKTVPEVRIIEGLDK